MQEINLQPTHLKNDSITLVPLQPTDFDRLFAVASDPKIWEQHPTKNRYQEPIFQTYFNGAMESNGAFIILDTQTGEVVGSSRFYDYNEDLKSIKIGYTFLATKCWGFNHNKALKTVMLNHAFTFVDTVLFDIGANNIRSQKAIAKFGAIKVAEHAAAYFGEQANTNFQYAVTKQYWLNK